MKPKIILSGGGKFHYYHTAIEIQKAGYLSRFFTGCYFKLESQPWRSFVHLANGSSRLRRFVKPLYSRWDSRLNSDLVTSIVIPEIAGRLLRFIRPPYRYWLYANLFDLIVSLHLKACNIFHGTDCFSLLSATKAKRAGAFVVIDQKTAHPEIRKKLLQEEYQQYGISAKFIDELLLNKQKREYEIADLILLPSQFAFKTFIAQGVSPEKLVVLPFGVDTGAFKPVTRKQNFFRIIFVGRICLNKGVQYLLEAFKKLRLSKAELLLIGNIEEDAKDILRKYEGLFIHKPYVPNNALFEYYANSSVLVQPSIVEGSSLVIYEAMSCGIPVIATENSGSAIEDGVDGFVIPAKNTHSIMQKILLLHNDPKRREEMGRLARKSIEKYTWDTYGERLSKIHNDLFFSNKPI